MWIIGVMRGKTRSNAKLSVSEDAFIIKTGLRIMSDFVNWIRIMQAFDGEILCMLMYAKAWFPLVLRIVRILQFPDTGILATIAILRTARFTLIGRIVDCSWYLPVIV